MQRVKQNSVTIVFLTFLVIVTVLLFTLPKAEYSENEKRTLAKFPQLSVENITSGNFGKEFETYLADHFPVRDLFYGIHSYVQLYTGRNGVSGMSEVRTCYKSCFFHNKPPSHRIAVIQIFIKNSEGILYVKSLR